MSIDGSATQPYITAVKVVGNVAYSYVSRIDGPLCHEEVMGVVRRLNGLTEKKLAILLEIRDIHPLLFSIEAERLVRIINILETL